MLITVTNNQKKNTSYFTYNSQLKSLEHNLDIDKSGASKWCITHHNPAKATISNRLQNSQQENSHKDNPTIPRFL